MGFDSKLAGNTNKAESTVWIHFRRTKEALQARRTMPMHARGSIKVLVEHASWVRLRLKIEVNTDLRMLSSPYTILYYTRLYYIRLYYTILYCNII